MKKLAFILFVIFSVSASAQRITTKQSKNVADSILKARVGERLYQYFGFTTANYTYKHRRGYELTGSFLRLKKLPVNFTALHFLYRFKYPDLTGVTGGVWVVLDTNLHLKDSLDFNFIPDFVKENRPPDFIPVEKAIEIAKEHFAVKEFAITTSGLVYDSKLKLYMYRVYNKFDRYINAEGKDSGKMEIIEINAFTGAIISMHTNPYPIYIR